MGGLVDSYTASPSMVDSDPSRTVPQPERLFEHVPAGLFVAGPDGRYLDANPYGLALLGYSRDELVRLSLIDVMVPEEPGHVPPRLRELNAGRVVVAERRLRRKDGSSVWVEITGRRLPDGNLLGLVHDISERKAAEARMRQLTRLYAFLSHVNEAIVRTHRAEDLYPALCRVAVEHGGLRMAWCGIVDRARRQVVPIAHAGLVDGYLDGLVFSLDGNTGQGPTAAAVRDGRLTIIADIAADPRMGPWRVRAMARGYGSIAAVPLSRGGEVVAVLDVYAAEPAFFSDEERALLTEIGNDVSFALGSYDAEQRRQAAEQARAAADARIEEVLASSPTVVYTIAVEGGRERARLTWVSPNVRLVLGYDPAAVTGIEWWREHIHPDDRARVVGGVDRLFADGILSHEYRFRAGDDRYVWLLEQVVLRRDAAGRPLELIGAWTDISRRREAEETRLSLERQLLHAQKMESLGVLAGGIAHDFNNLLMALIGHLELATLELPPGAPARANIQQAARAAHRAAHLTRQMLAYSGRGRFVTDVLDLGALVRDHVALMRASLPRTVALDTAVEPDTLIEADAGQVEQVVMNLITNAADAIGERGGGITVHVYESTFDEEALAATRVDTPATPGRFVVLEISDDGCGMDAATRQRLFEPFFTTKTQGRGLGMAAILGIVRSHKGAIFVDSQPGAGSRFRVLFPVAEPPPATSSSRTRTVTITRARIAPPPAPSAVASEAPAASAAAALPRRVLFVDDEERLRRLGARLLRHLGIESILAADGLEALELYDRHASEIDLVILDLSMPRLDGYGALAELRKGRRDLPVLLSSGYDEREATRRIPGDAATWALQKPYSLDALRAKLAEMWAHTTAAR